MNQEKVSLLIKKIRKDNNLTQKDLAYELSVTYQAVSKWENGKNLPDISIMTMLCEKFGYDVSDYLEFSSNPSRKGYKSVLILSIVCLVIIFSILILFYLKKTEYDFKTINTTCEAFSIKGSVVYNDNNSYIYISNIDYCGVDEEDNVYSIIKCVLYENYKNEKSVVSKCDEMNNINLRDYLKDLTLKVDNYNSMCKRFSNSNLFLEIIASNKKNRDVVYKIPLVLEDNC